MYRVNVEHARMIKSVIDQLPERPARRNTLADMPDHLLGPIARMRRHGYQRREVGVEIARRKLMLGNVINFGDGDDAA